MFSRVKKRLTAIFSVIALSFSMVSALTINAEEAVYQLSSGAKVLSGLGIIENTADDIMMSNITRGDVAQILYNISKFGEKEKSDFNESQWEDDFFGELSQDLKVPEEQKAAEFGDVQENNAYFEAVSYVTTTGLMSGAEEGRFNIDGEVTYIEAVKIILDMVGYSKIAEVYGGYPTGYKQILSNENIGIIKSYDELMTYDDFAKFLYACFDLQIPKLKISDGSYEITYNENETFLSKKLGLNILKGRVTDNGITNLLSESVIGEDSIAIDDMVLNVGEDCEYIRTYLGYQVVCYYTNSEHEEAPVAVYAEKIKETENIVFNIEDFEELTKTNISYIKPETGKLVNTKLSQGYKMIVNGMAEDSYNNGTFDFDYGTITLTKSKSGNFDIIIVEGYNSCFVMNVDKTENIIYNKIADSKENNYYNLDDYEYVTVVNTEGVERSFAEIDENDVLDISENDNIIKIVITENKQDEITVKNVDNEENEVSDGEKNYELSNSFTEGYASNNILVGKVYTVYLNNANQIVWAEVSSALSEWTAAYLIKSYLDDESATGMDYCMKVYTENGAFDTYVLSEKVKLSDTEDISYNQPAEAIYERIKAYSGLIRIKLYEDKVKQIELPLESAENVKSDDRLFKMFQSDGIWTNGVSFGKNAFWNTDSVVMSVPADKNDVNKYAIQSVGIFRNTTTHAVDAYGIDPKSKVSKYFVTSSSKATTFSETTPVMVVSKITQECDDEGEIYYLINGLNSNGTNITSIKVPIDENIMENVKAPYRALNTVYDVEIGDVIRYTLDSDGFVSYMEIIFDANAENPLYPNEVKGWLCGSDGKAPTDTTRVANPYVVTHEGTLYYAQLDGYGQNQGMRIIYGWVENYRDGVITINTQSPIGGFDKTLENNGKSYSESYVYNPTSVTYVNYLGKTCTPINTNKSIIRDYENYASRCSRVLILTNYGSVKAAVFMDGEMN